MRRILSALLTALVAVSLTAASVFAASASIRGVSFSLGSLIAKGQVVQQDPHQQTKIVLQTSGPADVICKDTNGHLPDYFISRGPVVSATGHVWITADGHGRANFEVRAKPPRYINVYTAGCPHGYEKALVDFVYFTHTSLTAKDIHGAQLDLEVYRCETTRECVVCKKARH
jgi:hypothetical protein